MDTVLSGCHTAANASSSVASVNAASFSAVAFSMFSLMVINHSYCDGDEGPRDQGSERGKVGVLGYHVM